MSDGVDFGEMLASLILAPVLLLIATFLICKTVEFSLTTKIICHEGIVMAERGTTVVQLFENSKDGSIQAMQCKKDKADVVQLFELLQEHWDLFLEQKTNVVQIPKITCPPSRLNTTGKLTAGAGLPPSLPK